MNLPNGLERLQTTQLTNRHENFTQPLTAGASFKLRIPLSTPAQPLTSRQQYQQTTTNFQWLIRHAIQNQLRLRALGSNWSFTEVGATNGGMVDTKALQQSFALRQSFVHADFLNAGGSPGNLFFTECGMSVLGLEEILEPRGKSLRASGASNGQTIAGALSTGTHGAAYQFGAVHDAVLGLHIVTGPDRHVWVERASRPVASDAFTQWLGVTDVWRDDDLFNAAVVSFGSFGFIHGVLLDIEDLFWLKSYSNRRVRYDQALRNAMIHQDFSGLAAKLQLPPTTPDLAPYHFQMIVNPHQFDAVGGDEKRGAYVRFFYKAKQHPGPGQPLPTPGAFGPGDSTLAIIQTILDRIGPAAPLLVPKLVNTLYPQALEDTHGAVGTMSTFFSDTNVRGKAVSAAVGIAAADSPRVLEEVVRLNAQTPFSGLLGLRWVKQTPATLGFTRFPVTCVLELDAIESNLTRQFLQTVWSRLETLGIPYTLHWGKINFNLNEARVRHMYGGASVDAWRSARQRLLDAPTRAVFTNPFMERCGLDKTVAPTPTAVPVMPVA